MKTVKVPPVEYRQFFLDGKDPKAFKVIEDHWIESKSLGMIRVIVKYEEIEM